MVIRSRGQKAIRLYRPMNPQGVVFHHDGSEYPPLVMLSEHAVDEVPAVLDFEPAVLIRL
jgi:hypothetical protein